MRQKQHEEDPHHRLLEEKVGEIAGKNDIIVKYTYALPKKPVLNYYEGKKSAPLRNFPFKERYLPSASIYVQYRADLITYTMLYEYAISKD